MSPEEFTAIYQSEHASLRASLIAAGARPSDAEDVVHEAFVNMWRRADASQIRNVRAYLRAIAFRLMIASTQAKKPEQLRDFDEGTLDRLLRSTAPDDDDGHRTALILLGELPALQRSVMALVYDGHSPTETARLLATTPNNVRVALNQARRTLRRRLEATRPDLMLDLSGLTTTAHLGDRRRLPREPAASGQTRTPAAPRRLPAGRSR